MRVGTTLPGTQQRQQIGRQHTTDQAHAKTVVVQYRLVLKVYNLLVGQVPQRVAQIMVTGWAFDNGDVNADKIGAAAVWHAASAE
jgi:hypothetical protein